MWRTLAQTVRGNPPAVWAAGGVLHARGLLASMPYAPGDCFVAWVGSWFWATCSRGLHGFAAVPLAQQGFGLTVADAVRFVPPNGSCTASASVAPIDGVELIDVDVGMTKAKVTAPLTGPNHTLCYRFEGEWLSLGLLEVCGSLHGVSLEGGAGAATTSTTAVCQLLGTANAQMAPAGTSTAPAHQPLGSAETTPAGAPVAVADRTQQPDATCEGKGR